jgi:hypothetical protein
MGWTAPRTYVVGEVITATILNSAVRDNLLYLKGSNQVPTIQSGLIIDNTSGDEYFKLPLHTTSEATSVLNAEAKVCYDGTTHRIKYYNDDGVESLLNISDVNDTPVDEMTGSPISSNWAYGFINTLTASGDIPYANGAGSWTRLPKGAAGTYLKMNSTVSAPEWGTAALNTKLLSHTRSCTAAVGDIVYTGYGFTPKALNVIYHTPQLGVNGVGYGGASGEESTILNSDLLGNQSDAAAIIHIGTISTGQTAVLKSVSSDGFTFTWSQTSSLVGAVCSFSVLAFG